MGVSVRRQNLELFRPSVVRSRVVVQVKSSLDDERAGETSG